MRRAAPMPAPAWALVLVAVAWPGWAAGETPDGAPEPAAAVRGGLVFAKHCRACHGPDGLGNGQAARWLDVPPRDLVRAEYRWRTTPTGEPPTVADLLRTVDEGAFGTPMPAWRTRLPAAARRDLVAHVRTLSDRFSGEDPEPPLVIPDAPAPAPGDVEKGREAYVRLQCGTCHGESGRGDGSAAAELRDSEGRPVKAYDFTKGYFKGGRTPPAVYRTYMTGLDGTPMPSYAHAVSEAERWPLVFHTMSLARERGVLDWLLGPLEEQDP